MQTCNQETVDASGVVNNTFADARSRDCLRRQTARDAAVHLLLRGGRQGGLSAHFDTMEVLLKLSRARQTGSERYQDGLFFCCRPRSVMTPVRRRVRRPAYPYLVDARSLLSFIETNTLAVCSWRPRRLRKSFYDCLSSCFSRLCVCPNSAFFVHSPSANRPQGNLKRVSPTTTAI